MSNFTIDKTEAQARIQMWKDAQNAIKSALQASNSPLANSNVLDINAFTFHMGDIIDLLNDIGAANDPSFSTIPKPHGVGMDAIRFYLGERFYPEENTAKPCLIALPVDGFSTSLQNGSGGKDVTNLPVGSPNSSIYDFSFPCPATCPETGYGISDS